MKITDKMFEPHDEYERDLVEALKHGEIVSHPIGKEEMKELQDAARRKLEEIDAKNKSLSNYVRET